MIRVSSTEFGKAVERYEDAALSEPVVVTRDGSDFVVMISAEEYRRLKARDREVLGIEDFSEAEIEAVRASVVGVGAREQLTRRPIKAMGSSSLIHPTV